MYGGAIYSSGAAVTITGCQFRSCYADGAFFPALGGALYLASGSAEIADCAYGNTAQASRSSRGTVIAVW